MNDHSKSWRANDIVSRGSESTLAIGKVVILRRHSDNRPFVMVEVTGGTWKLGTRHWPEGWVLGTGRIENRCRDCGQDYRTDDGTEIFCPACNRAEDHADAESRTAMRLRLRGTATRAPAHQVESTAPVATDDVETPF